MDQASLARKEKWELEHVKSVLDYYSKKHGISIIIKGRSTKVYPELIGQVNWDWVCQETKTKDEIAIEVKQITDSTIEQKSNVLWRLLENVQCDLEENRVLHGIYTVSFDILRNDDLPLINKNIQQEFKGILYEVICTTAQKLRLNKERDLMPQIRKQLSFKLPDSTGLTIYKLSERGSGIRIITHTVGVWSKDFDTKESEDFQRLVKKANTQLIESHAKTRVLILIEEGHRSIDPPEVIKAFGKIEPATFSHINRVFFIRGEEVSEIPLPIIVKDR